MLSPVGLRNSEGTNRKLIQDNSMVSLNTNKNIASQAVFLTGVQGNNSRINSRSGNNEQSGTSIIDMKYS